MIELAEKSGFITGQPVDVYKNGELFLSVDSSHQKGNKYYFNLPAGMYNISNSYEVTEPLKTHEKIKLPRPERVNRRKPALYIAWEQNPNIGSINKRTGKITLDPSLKFQPEWRKNFILLHEVAHFNYKTESKCDLKAAKGLLAQGYDKKHCIDTVNSLRGRRNYETKKLIDKLNKL